MGLRPHYNIQYEYNKSTSLLLGQSTSHILQQKNINAACSQEAREIHLIVTTCMVDQGQGSVTKLGV